ncbi:MAG: polysulfide reductase NrfD [Chloroflexi bacterium]|nr:polysulfide reductase NrfD [Chloroflexota bacterium]
MATVIGDDQRLERTVLAPLIKTGPRYYAVVGVLSLIVAWGLFAYATQLRNGLVETGMRDRVLWGLYITNFVFFIGISHAGTLISAILRLAQAGWRTPVTRMAEFITVVALIIGAMMPIIDMGRPERVLNLVLYGRWQSPLVWDILAISTYLTGSIIYLLVPMIPDLALARDRLGAQVDPLRRWFFRTFSAGWHGTPQQSRYLIYAITIMMIVIIPVAVSVHTVVSWIFAMTVRVAWDSSVFGPFFVAGAIYSGIATIIIVMAILRKTYRLEDYITKKQFIYLAYMMGAFTLIMGYFNLQEYVTLGYKLNAESLFHFRQLFQERFAPFFWFYIIAGIAAPGLIILIPQTRTIAGIVAAAVLVDAGMWVERYFIVAGGLRVPLMPYEPRNYVPTWVEISITAGAFALFALLITLFVKLFPLIAVWEVKEHWEQALLPAGTEVSGLPHPAPSGAQERLP